MAAVDKLTPTDPRVEHHTAALNGKKYHYLLGNPPANTPKNGTILLVHGFPDLSLGWRYQVPYLLSLGLRVIVPDMPGYGRTDSPQDIAAYAFKSVCADLAALVAHVRSADPQPTTDQKIFLGGHDWGGAVVWRFALWHPDLLKGVFSICTPYWPPSTPGQPYVPRAQLIKTVLPNFAYQEVLAGPDVEAQIVGREKIKQFLRAMYGGRGPNKEVGFTTAQGPVYENLSLLGPSPLLSSDEFEFYADQFAQNDGGSFRGPLNWYRTHKVNFEDELELSTGGGKKIAVPALMVAASKDAALPPAMSARMDAYFGNLARGEVNTSHWALWEAPAQVNEYIGSFVAGILKDEQAPKASI
ncbi:Alpha/Beta hydrolase protein [Podospora didyma]|uniref:Alpha/Beta hydrolase protein n=1 Tax=Podospora didyma TaxID=330526 RepID=A0AAE0KFH3_9PEZI|nr:Alpha/Beta hydrolase protein [Podospora didyma]